MENHEKNKNQQQINYREIIDSIKDLLKELNVSEILNSYNNLKSEKIKSLNTANNINLSFWTRKFIKESIILCIILVAICYLAYNDLLDKNIIGTLIGSIIGYGIGNFNASNKEH